MDVKRFLIGLVIGVVIGSLMFYTPLIYEFCSSCHKGHGVIPDIGYWIPFTLAGDVKEPGCKSPEEIFKLRKVKARIKEVETEGVLLKDFLELVAYGKPEKIVLMSYDGFLVEIDPREIGNETLIVPWKNSFRIVSNELSIPSWIKGVTIIILVCSEGPNITVGNRVVTIGEILSLEPTLTVYNTRRVMFRWKNITRSVLEGKYTVGVRLDRVLNYVGAKNYSEIEIIGERSLTIEKSSLWKYFIAQKDLEIMVVDSLTGEFFKVTTIKIKK